VGGKIGEKNRKKKRLEKELDREGEKRGGRVGKRTSVLKNGKTSVYQEFAVEGHCKSSSAHRETRAE